MKKIGIQITMEIIYSRTRFWYWWWQAVNKGGACRLC